MQSNNINGPVGVRTAQTKTAESKQFDNTIRSLRTGEVDQYFTDNRKNESDCDERDAGGDGDAKWPLELPALLSFPTDFMARWIALISKLFAAGEETEEKKTSSKWPTADQLMAPLLMVFKFLGGVGATGLSSLLVSPMTLIKRPLKAIAGIFRRRD